MERLQLKWQTARGLMPKAEINGRGGRVGVLFYGTTSLPVPEALDKLAAAVFTWTPAGCAHSRSVRKWKHSLQITI